MAASLKDVQDKVTNETTVISSAVTLLGSLSDQIRAAANDPVAIQAIADGIDTNTNNLAQAVVANTPAAPAQTPVP